MAEVINCDKKILSKVQKQTISNLNHHLLLQEQSNKSDHHHVNNFNSNSVKHIISNVSSSNSTDLKYLHKKFKRLASATTIVETNSSLLTNKESTNLPITHRIIETNHIVSHLSTVLTPTATTISFTPVPLSPLPALVGSRGGEVVLVNRNTENNKQILNSIICANESESSSSSSSASNLVVNHHPPISLQQLSDQLQKDKLYRPIFNQFNNFNYNNSSSPNHNDIPSGLSSNAVPLNSNSTSSSNNNNNNSNISKTIKTISSANSTASPVVSLVSRDNRIASNSTDYDLLVAANESHCPIGITDSAGRQIVYTGNHKNLFFSELPSSASTLQKTAASQQVVLQNISSPNSSPLHYLNAQQQPKVDREEPQNRYVCPYCQLSCLKPSVLKKHIRAHTNERPYPCESCSFSFKTKSNLFKHCR
jgi:hypothetical protein